MNSPLVLLSGVGLSFRISRGLFRYSRKQVFDNLDLAVWRGETLGVIGRNGCGKSTLLRLVAGIYEPDSGSIDRGRCRINLLSLGIGFDVDLSGRDNILFSAMLMGSSRARAIRDTDEIIAFSELGADIDFPVKTYSTGMRMRLGFSIAMTMEPDVLLIDEALSTGDIAFRHKAESAIARKLQSEQTVVLVSHSNEQVRNLCDRVVWIDDGNVKLDGEPNTVIDAYLGTLRKRPSGDAG